MTKNEIYDEITKVAERERRPEESFEKSLDRLLTEQPQLHAAYRAADPDPEPIDKAASAAEQYEQLEAAAMEPVNLAIGELLHSDPTLTDQQALFQVLETNPSLHSEYLRRKSELLAAARLL